MLLKALYSYDGPFAGSLKISQDDLFLFLREENQYWQLVCREDGSVGCVPRNYVERSAVNDQRLVNKFANAAINKLNRSEAINIKDKTAILKILQKKTKVLTEIGDSQISSSSPKKLKNDPLVANVQNVPNNMQNTDNPAKPVIDIKPGLLFQLVDILRLGTNANYSDCRWSLLGILMHLSNELPSFKCDVDILYEKLSNGESRQKEFSTYYQSPDWFKLKNLFDLVEARQKNNQECTWELHQNQSDISLYLDRLFDLIGKTDPGLVLHYLVSTSYQPLSHLIQLYQQEHRSAIRNRLLLIIGVTCCLNQTCLRLGIQSVLPLELIRELTACNNSSDVLHISDCMRMLTILLARNTELPVNLKAQLDCRFGLLLLQFVGLFTEDSTRAGVGTGTERLENLIDLLCLDRDAPAKGAQPSQTRSAGSAQPAFGGRLSEAATLLLLAMNWHFCSLGTIRSGVTTKTNDSGNREFIPVVGAIVRQPTSSSSRHFIRLVVELFNRDLDPIFLVDYQPHTSAAGSVDLLNRWVEVLSDPPENNADLASCFHPDKLNCDDEETDLQVSTPTTTGEAVAGGYAQHFWSENLASRLLDREKPSAGLAAKLSAAVAPRTPVHSVIKMVVDLFASSKSARLIYGGDLEGILDVISRQLCNLSPALRVTADYLLLFGLLLTNTDYLTHGKQAYKSNEILSGIRTLLDATTGLPHSANVKRCVDYATGILTRMRSSMSD